MLVLKWDSRLELGVELIDRQHKEILDKANLFFISYKARNSDKRLHECLSFLENYVLYHFQAEEAYQASSGYPGYLSHQAEHNTLKMQFKFHATRLAASSFAHDDVDAFYYFMEDWICGHILDEDIRFADYYRSFMTNQDGHTAEK